MDDLSSVQSVLPRQKGGTANTAAAAAVGSHSTSSDSEPSWEWHVQMQVHCFVHKYYYFCIAILKMATLSLYVHIVVTSIHCYTFIYDTCIVFLYFYSTVAWHFPLPSQLERNGHKNIYEERSFPFQNLAHISRNGKPGFKASSSISQYSPLLSKWSSLQEQYQGQKAVCIDI